MDIIRADIIRSGSHAGDHTPITERVLDGLTRAKRAVVALKKRGHTVIQVIIAGRNPRILIRTCPRCADLQGAPRLYAVDECGRYRILVAELEGCQVEWIERGH